MTYSTLYKGNSNKIPSKGDGNRILTSGQNLPAVPVLKQSRGAMFGQTDKKYNFLNVLSSVREKENGDLVHVYDRARYRWKRKRDSDDYDDLDEFEIAEQTEDTENQLEIKKELTEYKGHRTDSLKESVNKPRKRGQIKSGKSIGKSTYSHSAGHGKTEKLLNGVKLEISKLWDQIRPVGEKENRRKLHLQRLYSMGPIRLYNLFANLILRNKERLKELSPKQIAGYIMELYINFVQGTTPSDTNPFHDEIEVISGSDFSTTVSKILEGEEGFKPDEAVVEILKKAFSGDKESLESIEKLNKSKLKIAMIFLLRFFKTEGHNVLHLAVSLNSPVLIKEALSAGANLEEENSDGLTPLAFALELNSQGKGNEEVIGLLLGTQDKQKKRKKTQLPDDWKKYSKKSDVGEEWLTDNEVRGGLTGTNLPDTHIAPAVNITDNPDVLAQFIRDNYLQQISNGAVAEYTVIPINFNNAHWATLVIRQNNDRRSAPTVYFFDSLGEDEKKIALINLMLRMTGVYTRVDNIVDLSKDLQEDGYTCGTWMIESATRIVTILANGGNVKDIQESMSVIGAVVRELHEQKLKLVESGREKKSKSESSMELVGTDDDKYHTFGNGLQEYSELWIAESFDEYRESHNSLAEVSKMLMASFENVDDKMQRIYKVYLYKIYLELSNGEYAGLFEEEIQHIIKFLKTK